MTQIPKPPKLRMKKNLSLWGSPKHPNLQNPRCKTQILAHPRLLTQMGKSWRTEEMHETSSK
jgi:hypothetical protein